jgi:arachidonate 15-lipoxygenase
MVDDIMSGSIAAIKRLAGENVTSRSFQDLLPPRALRLRGVEDPELLPEYPYRDDALRLWEALHAWVSSYLRIYYAHDGEVEGDRELQDWIRDITSPEGGRLKDVGENGRVVKRDVLAGVLATAIFMGSVQHSALNAPQGPVLCFAPAAPMASYRSAPGEGRPLTEQDWLDMLPPLERAQQQLEFGYRISSTQYGQLGRYEPTAFSDRRVEAPLRKLHARLEEIEAAIEARNRTASIPYESLIPSRISQSVNV